MIFNCGIALLKIFMINIVLTAIIPFTIFHKYSITDHSK